MRFLLFAALVGAGPWIASADLQGAKAVVEKISAETNAPTAIAGEVTAKDFKERIDALAKRVASLSPGDAASQWLELVDTYLANAEQLRYDAASGAQVEFLSTLDALPAPEAWPEIRKRVADRAALAKETDTDEKLLLLCDLLTGDRDALRSGLRNLAKKNAEDSDGAMMTWSISAVQKEMLRLERDPKILKALLLADLEAREKGKATDDRVIMLPDLVTLYGRDEADAILRRALVLPDTVLQINLGLETQDLARKDALELIDQLKTPCWSLVRTLDSVDLYEALDRKFPHDAPTPENEEISEGDLSSFVELRADIEYSIRNASAFSGENTRETADDVYLLGLIAAERTDDAVAVLEGRVAKDREVELHALDQLDKAGYTQQVFDFIVQLLEKHPQFPLWDAAIGLGARLGESDRVTQLVQERLAEKNLEPALAARLKRHLVSAMLAADRVDEAVVLLRELIKTPVLAKPSREDMWDETSAGDQALHLARLGLLLDRKELLSEGLAAAEKELRTLTSERQQNEGRRLRNGLAELYGDLKTYDKAETVLVDQLARVREQGRGRDEFMSIYEMRDALSALCGLYFDAGHPADVRYLLNEAPWWGVKDLSEVQDSCGTARHPVMFVAAKAMQAAGETNLARKMVTELVRQPGASDAAFEMLVDFDGINAIPLLDSLYALDRFEERPLIWKAEVLRRAGKLAEAEKTAREAITVDPSDGGTGKGDRMRVYAVLGAVRKELGDTKEAAFLDGVMTSIRHAEDADDFYQAGLLTRGVKMYEEALTYFSDAYCIQSRLAVQLAELGRQDEAAAHYQRAYELMPDSFGRMESHCFGCEHVFQGATAQSIAEKVFSRLVQEKPENPRVHYLLGYLRGEQENYPAAVEEFKRAIALDPDYLSAWREMLDVSEKMQLPAAELDDIAFNLMRLDPLQRHVNVPTDSVQDLARLWREVSRVSALIDPPDGNVYPLRASKERIEKLAKARGADSMSWAFNYNYQQTALPGAVVGRHRLVSQLARLLDSRY
jgi:tetratricopeptide (TPR) repeat protein